jgi:hypothetical protein
VQLEAQLFTFLQLNMVQPNLLAQLQAALATIRRKSWLDKVFPRSVNSFMWEFVG